MTIQSSATAPFFSVDGNVPLFTESGIRQLLDDVFNDVGTKYDDGYGFGASESRRVVTLDGLTDAIEVRIQYLLDEAQWNLDHGLTANCPECTTAMSPDKTWCSHRCYHAYREVLRENGIDDPTSGEAARLISKENRA